jgi:hypothetical protein
MSLLVNGRRFSHASLEITLKGIKGSSEIFIDVQEVSYADALEIVFVYGTNQAPLGATKGKYEPAEAVLKMGKSAIQKFLAKVGDGWLGSNLSVVIKYSDEGEAQIVDSFVGPIIGLDDSSSDGPDPIQPSIKLKPFYILRNKIKPLKDHHGL